MEGREDMERKRETGPRRLQIRDQAGGTDVRAQRSTLAWSLAPSDLQSTGTCREASRHPFTTGVMTRWCLRPVGCLNPSLSPQTTRLSVFTPGLANECVHPKAGQTSSSNIKTVAV